MSEDLRETDWNKIKNVIDIYANNLTEHITNLANIHKSDIDIYANNLTEHITNFANIHIPNKIIKIDLFHIVSAHSYIGHVARVFSIIG